MRDTHIRVRDNGDLGDTRPKIPNAWEFGGYMEKTVEAYLRDRVKAAGGLALKLVCPGWTGVPDRLILLPGARVYFAETKDLGKTPKKRQRYVHGRLRALGFQVFVPDSKPAVDAMLACILEEDSV